MDKKRRGHRDQYREQDPYYGGYYDNRTYFPDPYWQGPGIRYPSTYRTPKEAPFSVFHSSHSESTDSDLRSPSRKRTYVLIAIIVAAVLVVGAVVGAILAATLTGDSDNKATAPKTVEKIVEKAVQGEVKLTSKNWTDAYNDKNSVEYQTTAAEFIQKMDEKLQNTEISDKYARTVVKDIRQGSVVIDFIVVVFGTLTIVEDAGSPTTTTEVPGGGIGSLGDLGFELEQLLDFIASIPDIEEPVLSDVNECASNPCNNGGTCEDGVNRFTCACAPGYSGDTCELDVDECSSTPCQYNGICNDGLNGYSCACVSGTVGDNCETNVDDCETDTCKNGGTCTDELDGYTCSCLPGFNGNDCENNIDECNSSPCENGGLCIDEINQFTCGCKPGYIGDICETDINECDSNPCENDGICADSINQYTCECGDGFSGENCEINIDECNPNPCQNDAECTDGDNRYTCTCNPGWEGQTCNININDCEPNPCKNGECTDAVNGYTCECEAGWTGNDCDENIDECSSDPCQNDAKCTDVVNGYTCTCKQGWEGLTCDININDCEPNPCQNGACTDEVNDYTCDCYAGWSGNDCDKNINDCAPNPCEHGDCTDAVNGYTCSCNIGWTGENCDQNVNDCAGNPCQNGAICTDAVNSYTCACVTGWEGDNCDKNINDCQPDPCKNGACADKLNGYTCDCEAGWRGTNCDENIDECMSNPCENGGICEDDVNRYTCNCNEGFSGDNCETNVNECSSNPCKNGAECTDEVNRFTCVCLPGFEGTLCDINTDDCQGNPCKHGTCVDEVNDFSCSCDYGWMGKFCDEDYNECMDNPCENKAACQNMDGTFVCICNTGWAGQTCNIDIDECKINPSPCKNDATCENNDGSYKCTCSYGWEGPTCEIDINECQIDSSPCKNDATCENIEGSYKCTCYGGWEGPTCESDINECVTGLSPCKNGATCLNNGGSFTCICSEGWEGYTCEIDIPIEPSPEPTGEPEPETTDVPWTSEPEPETTDAPDTSTSTKVPLTTQSPCSTGAQYQYEIEGAILLAWDDDLDYSESELFIKTEQMLMESMHNATDSLGLSGIMCEIYLKQFYPVNASQIELSAEMNIGFTVAMIASTTLDLPVVEVMFMYMENMVFISLRAMFSTTAPTPTSPPSYPNQTCSSQIVKAIYSFNITYQQEFTDDLYNTSSETFMWLNQTVVNAIMQTARDIGADNWICNFTLVQVVPTVGNGSLSVSHETYYISAVFLAYVPPDKSINELAYIVYLTASDEGMFSLVNYDVVFVPSSPTTPVWTTPSPYPNQTCSSQIVKAIYSFNITYRQEFTDDLYNTSSEAFMWLNQTVVNVIMQIARENGADNWICNFTLVQVVPTIGNGSLSVSHETYYISALFFAIVPPDKNIYELAFIVYLASSNSGIFALVNYDVYYFPFTTTTPVSPTPSSCDPPNLPCPDGSKCIPPNWFCDDIKDCDDSSDEMNCPNRTTPATTTRTIPTATTTIPNWCSSNQHQCPNGKCIPLYYLCDGLNDCNDNTDEVGCGCGFDEFECENGFCISDAFVCNEDDDCSDASDEIGCGCASDQFKCKNFKECINSTLHCDGTKDCMDGTDEFYNCTQQPTPSPLPIEYEIRLMDGENVTTAELYGRVEVRRSIDGEPIDEFGTICDDSWGAKEAEVVCRSLNASDPSLSFAYPKAAFGQGSGSIWLRNIHCLGYEDRLEQCKSSNWGRALCSHHQDASVSCGIDRVTTTTTTTTAATTGPTLSTPVTSPAPDANIRLVDGDNCLEGRIEVFYNGEWGTVCRTGFSYQEAQVVCRSLGFSGYSLYYYQSFGYGTGPIFLSNLACTGEENSLFDCSHDGWGDTYFCDHSMDQGIRCYGDPEEDCNKGPGVPSVNCTFDEDKCAYSTAMITGYTDWKWTRGSDVGIMDANYSFDGRLMIYQNAYGSEIDSAKMWSPMFSATSTAMKAEFYYQLHESSYNNLMFSLNEKNEEGNVDEEDERVLWNSVYLRRDQEFHWLYECSNLADLNVSSNYSLVFRAKRGPSSSSAVGVDDILVTDGTCAESLLDGVCDFDKTSACGMSLECASCDRTRRFYGHYSWLWQSNRTYSRIPEADGYFMVANSTFGTEEDDTARMSFNVPSIADRTAVSFLLHMHEENGGKLEVQLHENDAFHSTLQTFSGGYGRRWREKCVQLPSDISTDSSITITFIATRGRGMSADIAIDNVELITGECPHPVVTCADELHQCGWETSTNDPEFYWKFVEDGGSAPTANNNIRLVDGPNNSSGQVEVYHNGQWGGVCDDSFGKEEAMVVCRSLGYPTENADYTGESTYSKAYKSIIWLDEVVCTGSEESIEDCKHNNWGDHDCSHYNEHVAVHCYGEVSGSIPASFDKNFFKLVDKGSSINGSWASLSSRNFSHEARDSRFMFDLFKSGDEVLQIWYNNHAQEKTYILDKLMDSAGIIEPYCIDISAEIHGVISLGLTAFKGAANSVETAVKDFALERGSCQESVAQRDFTFESDYMLYEFDVSFTENGENSCKPRYEWKRVSARFGKVMDKDHTFGNDSGHFMYVTTALGEPEDLSELTLQVPEEESVGFCSLQFYYFKSEDGSLSVSVNSATMELSSIPMLHAWLPGCINLVDTCGDDPGPVDVKFRALDVEAGIDDVVLSNELCPEIEHPSVDCLFLLGETCGYFMDSSVWIRGKEGNLTSVAQKPGSYLISPLFNVPEDSCASVAFANTPEHIARLMVIDSDGHTVSNTEFQHVPYSTLRQMDLNIQTGINLRLYFEAYSTAYGPFAEFSVLAIGVLNGSCEFNVLSCDDEDLECGGKCVTSTMICDGKRDCQDGSDEKACECGLNTFNCTSHEECVGASLMCDRFQDCTDGSDEDFLMCGSSVNCSFTPPNWHCGYKLYNADQTFDAAIGMSSMLAYISSPAVNITDQSCLVVEVPYNDGVNIRILSYDGEMYTVLYQTSGYYTPLTLLVDIEPGNYDSLIIETQSTKAFGNHYAVIDEITLFERNCKDSPTTPTFPTTPTKATWPTTTKPPWYITTKKSTTTAWQGWTSLPTTTTNFPFHGANKLAHLDSTTEATKTTKTSLPDDFPWIDVPQPDTVEYGGSVNLLCNVTHGPSYILILSWLSDDTEVSRNGHIMVGDGDQTKYGISMTFFSTGTLYELTVYDVTTEDEKKEFTCVADVLDYYPSNFLRKSTALSVEEDGCNGLGGSGIEEFCNSIGYSRVTVPTASGLQTMNQVYEVLSILQDIMDTVKSNTLDYEQHQCYIPLRELACGLHLSRCQKSDIVKPVCREHCQEIADACMSAEVAIVSNNNTDLDHYCRYLQSGKDRPDCTEIWLGCDVTIMLGTSGTPTSARLRSENYPDKSPSSSPCKFSIAASPYYSLELKSEEVLLGDECSTNYLQINDERFCSNNASLLTMLQADEAVLNISLVSNSADKAGFLLSVSQELPADVCDVIEVKSDDSKIYNGFESGSESCTEWIFYTTESGYEIGFNFTEVEACLNVLDDNSDAVQEICTPQSETDLTMNAFKVKTATAGTGFKLLYTLKKSGGSYDFTIDSVDLREGSSENEGKVYITLSDGRSGYLCGYMNFGAASVICGLAGYGTPAISYLLQFDSVYDEYYDGETKDVILYDLSCTGNERSITECYSQDWADTCTGGYCYCYSYSSFRGVRCPMVTASCNLTISDCGYEYNQAKVYLSNTIKFGDGLYMFGSTHDEDHVTTPSFTYFEGESVTFEYSFQGVPGDKLALSLRASDDKDILIWHSTDHAIDGRYRACVALPGGYSEEDVQMVFTVTMAPSDNNHTIGLHSVQIKKDNCPGQFPANECSFDSTYVCEPFLPETCLGGAPVWNIIDNTLEGSSASAMQDTENSVSFGASARDGQYLRFRYSQTGVGVANNDLTLRVDIETQKGVTTVFSDNNYQLEWEYMCIHLPSTGDETFTVSYILTKSVSEGNIYLDDIELNDEICPHPVSCDFENCNYNIQPPSSVFTWTRLSKYDDHTFGGQQQGYVMQAGRSYNSQTGAIGNTAIFSTPFVQLKQGNVSYVCLSFFYKLYFGSDKHCKLEVNVFHPETNETSAKRVETFVPYTWQEVNIKLDPEIYSTVQVSFLATPIHGYFYPALAIDDVEFLTTDCVDGLQDLDQCDFNNSALCGLGVNCTVDSGYIWRIHSGNTAEQHTGPSYDADGSEQGLYMFLDSSYGDDGHESFMWFTVDLSNELESHYTFSYYMTGNTTGTLWTFYRVTETGHYSHVSVIQDSGGWHESDCFDLPPSFRGEIYIQAIRGDSVHKDKGIDNVKVTKKSCPAPSVDCGFTDSNCRYKSTNWELEGGYISNAGKGGALHFPLNEDNIEVNSCISFDFESEDGNTLILAIDTDDGQKKYAYKVYSGDRKRGQITLDVSIDKRMKFVVPGEYLVKIDSVSVTPGECSSMACETDEITCLWQCVPNATKCDRNWDCSEGEDENDCGFSIPCGFSNGDGCGFATLDGSATEWSVVDSYTFNYDGTNTTVTGGILVTSLKGQSPWYISTVISTLYSVEEPSYVRFDYLGTVPTLTATVDNKDLGTQTHWHDPKADMTPGVWRKGQIAVESGTIVISFSTSLSAADHTSSLAADGYSSAIYEDPFVAIDNIEVLSGDITPPECPEEAPYQCDDGSLCYSEAVRCDRKAYCSSGSDESPENCASEFTLACDFEDASSCGYTVTGQAPWRRTAAYYYQIPPEDHTRPDGTPGHFLRSSNWDNDHTTYEYTIATSPSAIFPQDGCLTFWYYLNSTATQPTALSAQILVFVNYLDLATSEFLWYDYVDRPMDRWIQGGVPVRKNQTVSSEFVAITFETALAWAGVVALDDIEFVPGECVPFQDCHGSSFECRDTGVCIPEAFICNGKEECGDGSDENNCENRPDGKFQLVGGDGSYGLLQYSLGGIWQDVCFPDFTDIEYFEFVTTQDICTLLGYDGNSESFEYSLRDTTTEAVSITCEDGDCSHGSCSYGAKYAGLKCSNTVCFSGTKLCPGTPDTCVPTGRFCDGLPDCPNNSDEKECFCKEGDTRCTRTPDKCENGECEKCSDRGMTECQDHTCINGSMICDGHVDCSDGLDEYKCVQIIDHQVSVYYQSERRPLCFDNIDRTEAEALCTASGRGLLASGESQRGIQRGYTKVDNGFKLTESSNSEGFLPFLPGRELEEEPSCYPLILNCELPECGTAAYIDDIVSSFIPHGNKAVAGEWPYHGTLRKNNELWCGCSFLGGDWALTAAHCVEDRYFADYTVIFGSTVSDEVGAHGQQASVIDIHSHPEYNPSDVTYGNDIAVLKLSFAPIVGNYTIPVCLGTEASWQHVLSQGHEAECYITGSGANELYFANGDNPEKDLAETRVGIVDRETCVERYFKVTGDEDVISHDGICLENREPYQSACYGDSGGPFVCKNKIGRWEQFGVTSYGSSWCKAFVPVVYVNVVEHREWIESKTNVKYQDEYSPGKDNGYH